MPSADILIESKIEKTFRVEQVCGMFDVPKTDSVSHHWSVNIPIEDKNWQIGLIVGPSGSGKTTIGKRLFPDAYFHEGYEWPKTASILDGFSESCKGLEITSALSSVGFSSPPHWLKRYSHLSNGQKFRCELARLLLENADTVVFDEFTSVVDRDAAKISSLAVAKALRKRKTPKLIALSCHYDIIDWLDPDWVYNVSTGDFSWRLLRQRPTIELQIYKTNWRAWKLFAGHHYLASNISKAASCFVATWNDVPVAFTSYLTLVHRAYQNCKREHRTVVLPDYQGAGIGNKISEWVGDYLKSKGLRFRSTTSHPSMIHYRSRSSRWKMVRCGHVAIPKTEAFKKKVSAGRHTASFEYVG